MKTEYGLGRLPAKDDRDKKFMLRLPEPPPERWWKYWNQGKWWGNQGQTSMCVGYAWAGFLENGPIQHSEEGAFVDPTIIYHKAQQNDEWEGEDYDGTSVRAGAKVIQSMGHIAEYVWAFNFEQMQRALLTVSPVVVGTNWYTNMFEPDSRGLIRVGGHIEGGHAYLLTGINNHKGLVRIKNSWGRDWGRDGDAWIGFDDIARLIQEDGEVCLTKEIRGIKIIGE